MLRCYRILREPELLLEGFISMASTISDKEHQLALMEDDFLAIQWKMDRINQKLADLYTNWQAEYRNVVTSEDCEEVKRF